VFVVQVDNQVREGDDDLCSRLLRKKYLKGRFFFSVGMLEGAGHNFERVYMKQSMYVGEGLNMWWEMGSNLDSGMKFG
jgi:hypothetical protein